MHRARLAAAKSERRQRVDEEAPRLILLVRSREELLNMFPRGNELRLAATPHPSRVITLDSCWVDVDPTLFDGVLEGLAEDRMDTPNLDALGERVVVGLEEAGLFRVRARRFRRDARDGPLDQVLIVPPCSGTNAIAVAAAAIRWGVGRAFPPLADDVADGAGDPSADGSVLLVTCEAQDPLQKVPGLFDGVE
jgi:hypothetical protein